MLTLELIFHEFQFLSHGVALRSTTRWLLMLSVKVGGIIEIDFLVSIVVQSVELLCVDGWEHVAIITASQLLSKNTVNL